MLKTKHTFFCAELNKGILNEEESKHAIRVLRLNSGDIITVIDGNGCKVIAKITSADKKELVFSIQEEIEVESLSTDLHIAICPTKSIDRFGFFLEKVTELGIKEISPILSSNSERKILKIEKLTKGLISAIKQSGNLFLPKLHEMQDFKSFINRDFGDSQLFIAHCEDDEKKMELKTMIGLNEKIVILIGPEGDFTQEEINLAKENGFKPISLGKSRLRTETAGIIACHTVHLYS